MSRQLLGSRLALIACTVGILAAYGNVIERLIHDWATDDNYTHGFVLAPVAAYLVWRKRAELRAASSSPSASGFLVTAGALAVLIVGAVAADLFLMRLSLLMAITGVVVSLWGWTRLRLVAFPLALLLLVVPLPAIIFNQISFPLQLLASRIGVSVLQLTGVPALREGNVILLANTQLEVAEACSGLRSLVSLFSIGLLYSYFTYSQLGARVAITMLTIPVAVLTNALRVAGTGVAAHLYGTAAATGFLHTFSGWLMFVVSMALLMGAGTMMSRLEPAAPQVLGAQAS